MTAIERRNRALFSRLSLNAALVNNNAIISADTRACVAAGSWVRVLRCRKIFSLMLSVVVSLVMTCLLVIILFYFFKF